MRELVNAWVAWDRWANGARKRRRPNAREGQYATDRLVTELACHADRAGVPHMVLRDRINAARREGATLEQAVARSLSVGRAGAVQEDHVG
jgi:hypothetical protein